MNGRVRRTIVRGLVGLSALVLFVVASVGGLLLHLDLPPSRRLAATITARVLGSELRGSFEVAGIEELSPYGLRVERFDVRDPDGELVLRVQGLRARADLLGILRDALFDSGKLTIVIEHARVERARVLLLPVPGASEPTLAVAFTPRGPSTPGGRPVRVWLPAIELGRGHVSGRLAFAPSLEGRVSGVRGSVLVAPDGVAVDAPQFAASVRGLLAEELRAVGSFHQRGTTHFWSTLDGYVGEVQYNLSARLDGDHLSAKMSVPHAEPEAVRRLLPDWPLLETAAAEVEVVGDLPKLRVQGTAGVSGSRLRVQGDLDLAAGPRAVLAVEGERLDLRAVVADAPATRFDARSTLDLRNTDAGVVLEGEGTSEPTEIEGVPVPGTHFRAHYDKLGLSGVATLFEPGMPLEGTFRVEPSGTADFEAHAARFRVNRVPRVAAIVSARGALELRAKAHLEKGNLAASFSADVRDLVVGPLSGGSARASGTLEGPLKSPRRMHLDVKASGSELRLGALELGTSEARASGPLDRLVVSADFHAGSGAELTARTELSAWRGTHFTGVELTASRDQHRLRAIAAEVTVNGGAIDVRDARLEGAGGTLVASAKLRPGVLRLSLSGGGLDLDALAGVLGLTGESLGGKLNVAAEVEIEGQKRHGTLEVAVKDGRGGPLEGLNLDAKATLDNRSLSGEVSAAVADLGTGRASFELWLDGSPLEARSFSRATGRLDVGVERLELAALARLLPLTLPVRKLTGSVTAQLSLVRADPEARPELSLLAATSGLALEVPRGDREAPIAVHGIEAQLNGRVSGATGVAEGTLALVDQNGVLLVTHVRESGDPDHLPSTPAELVAELATRPVDISFRTDGRRLDELPDFIRPAKLSGVLSAELNVRGTLKAPVLFAKASLRGFTFGDGEKPFDACARAQYDPAERRIGVGGEAHLPSPSFTPCAGRAVALAEATGTANLPALARGERGFRGNADLALDGAPLDLVPALAEMGVAGSVSGHVALVETDEQPQLIASIKLDEGGLGGTAVGSGELDVRSDGKTVRVTLELERDDSKLDAEGRAALAWERLWPTLDLTHPALATARIEHLDAGMLAPLVGGALAELAGRIDGQLDLALTPRTKGAPGYTGNVTGKVSLRDGAMRVRGLDMRFTDISLDAEAKRMNGRNVIALRNVSAASRSRKPNVSAAADLYLDGLTLTGGRANVNLKSVPFLLEGVSQATLTGSASVALEQRPDMMLVNVSVPELTAELPSSTGRNVIALDDHPAIEIVQPLAEPMESSDAEAQRWQLVFQLGKKVRVKRAGLEIPLHGTPVLTLGKDVDVTGDIELEPGGRVQLLGKAFSIESGEVHFDTGEPSNPRLRVLARWRAPDTTTVYVEVRGTLREATLRFESDPPRSEEDIQAMLLTYGMDVGAAFADTPLQGLQLGAAAETGLDDRTYATYTAAVQISDEIWFEGSYKAFGGNGLGSESESGVSGTVNWRFRQNWSLRTEIGNIGTGLDLSWQYQY